MLEPIENQYLLMGYVNRAHGVNGEVLIISNVYAPTLFDNIDLVHLQDTRGDLFPARISSVRASEKNNRLSFFVQFEHIADRTEAEQLKGFPVYVNRDIAMRLINKEEQPEDYTSYTVLNEQNKPVGEVQEVLENPAHPILRIVTQEGWLLVPFVDEYIISSDREKRTIQCQNLDQLEDL